MADQQGFPHGTVNGYGNLGCRCEDCREANIAYVRARRRRLAAEKSCPNCKGPGGTYADGECKACYDYRCRTGRLRWPAPTPHDLVKQLHEAVYGSTWARPESPQQVWAELLREVRRLARQPTPLHHHYGGEHHQKGRPCTSWKCRFGVATGTLTRCSFCADQTNKASQEANDG